MNYIKSCELDLEHTFFHFTKISNRNSIERNGLKAVAGGENNVGNDDKNPTIYFSYGVDGLLKILDVWIKWEYNRMAQNQPKYIKPWDNINKDLMDNVYNKIYKDFKERMFLKLDLKEGSNPLESDFSFDSIDQKKASSYKHYQNELKKYEINPQQSKPTYPSAGMKWMYGSYSDFNSLIQENWNMNTHIGEKTISPNRIKIIESCNNRTDALSFAIETYNNSREKIKDIDSSTLDDFMKYAKKKYKSDEDYEECSTKKTLSPKGKDNIINNERDDR